MPYIKSDNNRREKLQKGEPALVAGELNYQIFYYIKHNYPKINIPTIDKYVQRFLYANKNYQRYNDMTGCLIRCAKEIKRRLNIDVRNILIKVMESYDNEIAKYEDTKINSNGDVE